MTKGSPRNLLACCALLALLPGAVDARVTRMFVEHREAVPEVAGAPEYEIIRGRFYGEVDPDTAANEIITDLTSAERNARGMVEYSATFAIARPLDAGDASGVLFYNVPNRGNGNVQADAEGHVRVISGWQGDLAPAPHLQTAMVPQVHGQGVSLVRLTNIPAGTHSAALAGGIGQPVPRPVPVSLDPGQSRLFVHDADDQPLEPVSADAWAFADCSTTPFPGVPDPSKLCLRDGFAEGQAYTLAYLARDPHVLGLGFAATRDLVAFLRHAQQDDAGQPNPVAGLITDAVASGTSQSGNFLRSFVHLGFNADELGRRVFDGINPDIAARQVPLNIRFGIPGGAANLFEPGSEGALWWSTYDDVVRGRGGSSLLARCSASDTCPKVIETFGSAEFWGLKMSPNLVGTDAARDIPLLPNVRRYYFPGVTHGGSRVGGFPTAPEAPFPGQPACAMANNPNPSADSLRAAQRILVAWVRGIEPPPSAYPTLAAGDLVLPDASAMGWPAIPGAPVPTGKINRFLDYDFGPDFAYGDISGAITRQPPAIRREIVQLVPRVDADGNEVSGVPSVQMLVPLGTYTGWNEQAQGWGAGGGCGFVGGFIPFASTRAERLATGDPRLSLEERYTSHSGFVQQVRTVVAQRLAAGWLLPDDAARLIAEAEASDVLR